MIGLKQQKRDLFGGTLRCAGLAAIAFNANALADIAPAVGVAGGTSSYTNVFAYDNYGGFQQTFDVVGGGDVGFAGTSSYSLPGLELSAYTSSTLVGASATMSIPGAWDYVGARVLQYFTVVNSKDMLIEWDFTGFSDGAYSSYAFVYQVGVGALLVENSYAAPGSTTITMVPGEVYLFRGNIGGFGDGGDSKAFVRMSNVPGAAVLPLLAVGALVGRRRRR